MRKIIKNIHLWLSVPFGVFITLICFSGAMLVFEKEITGLIVGEAGGERLPFFTTMFKLHRWLLGSPTTADGSISAGKLMVGCSTLALIVILITGVWLCCLNGRSLKQCFTISFNKGWKRFFYDLHVAGGLYSTLFLLALALTGLTWSFSWYRTGFYAAFGVEAPVRGHGGPGGQGGHGGPGAAHGAFNHGGPSAEQRGGQGEHGAPAAENAGQGGPMAHRGEQGAPAAEQRGHGGEHGAPAAEQRGHGDGHGAPTMKGENRDNQQVTPEQEKASKVRAGIYKTHVGSWGGMLTRILTFLAVLIGATLPLTGYYLWLKRILRKKK
jgi:uncharacterized iron-regulated membrane protein